MRKSVPRAPLFVHPIGFQGMLWDSFLQWKRTRAPNHIGIGLEDYCWFLFGDRISFYRTGVSPEWRGALCIDQAGLEFNSDFLSP